MSIPITIAGTTFNFPQSGEDPNWGSEATDTIVALADAINTLLAPGDILSTEFSIDNNISVATNINGLLFDSGTVRSSVITYSVYRISTANPSGHAETGQMEIVFDDSAASGMKWSLTQNKNGNAGIVFSVGDNGQFQYISSDINAVGYVGTITFSAKSISK